MKTEKLTKVENFIEKYKKKSPAWKEMIEKVETHLGNCRLKSDELIIQLEYAWFLLTFVFKWR